MTSNSIESALWVAASIATAAAGPVVGLPPEQQVYLWSVAGTVVGAAVAAAQMPTGTTHGQRAMRAILSAGAGLLLAPYAIAYVPRPDELPHWWHAFAASGIAAALAYVVVTEAPKLLRRRLYGVEQFDADHHPRRRRGDRT